MANTYVDDTATAAQTDFAFSFPYLEDEHVTVEINGVATTDFTIVTTPATKVVLDTPATGGEIVRVQRVSAPDQNLVDFVNGSVLTESELDRAYLHNRYLAEESAEQNDVSMRLTAGATGFDALNKKIFNVVDPTSDQDAATKNYVDETVAGVALGTLPDGSITAAKLDTDAVTTAKIEDNAIIESKIADDAVTTDKISDNSISSAKIQSSAVTSGKIANQAVTADKINLETGNLGIGTLSPQRRLHIKTDPVIVLTDDTGDETPLPQHRAIVNNLEALNLGKYEDNGDGTLGRFTSQLMIDYEGRVGVNCRTATNQFQVNDFQAITGTVSTTATSKTVTGSGTAFLTELVIGDYIKIGDEILAVETVDSDTQITLEVASTVTASGSTISKSVSILSVTLPLVTIISPLRLTGLPTSSSGLVSGDVWNNSGVLNIVP